MAIKRGQLEDFIRHALELANADAQATRKLGCTLLDIEYTETGNVVHAWLSDGSHFYIEVDHLVPRDYFKFRPDRGESGGDIA